MGIAFEKLKNEMFSPPVLAYLDLEKSFIFEVDASTVGVGAVMEQKEEDEKFHPIQYAKRAISKAEKN